MKQVRNMILLLLLSAASYAQDITGDWNGTLKVQSIQLRLVIHVSKAGEGYTATMDSPDQNARGLPVSQIGFASPVFTFSISSAGISYEGSLNEKQEIIGNFKQGGQVIPLVLSKNGGDQIAIQRPQTPVKPYPYYSEEVSIINSKDNVTLAGTLTLPKKEGSFPAVILITGSGAQNRDEEVFQHKPFLVIADYLTRNGIAVLRYDDRGVFGSTGNFSTSTSEDFVRDVEAGLAFLESRKEIDKKSIGLIGHSEGGMIAPIVASKHKEITFIVLLAGPGIPGDELLIAQGALLAKASGMAKGEIDPDLQIQRDLVGIVKSSKDNISLVNTLTAYYKKALKENSGLKKPEGVTEEAFIQSQIAQLTSPWMVNYIKYDPAPTLALVHCPVLALNGAKDLQVPPKENLAAIKAGLEKGGNKNVTVKELPGLNHLFQEAGTGSPEEYGTITQTFSPVALEAILGWLKGQVFK
ncbi:MAG: alpha/beta hydrolase [Chitinophagaceae bacterium]